jgi:fibrillarin-like pre-rRNA processing protein
MVQEMRTILPGVRYVDVVGHKRIATVATASKSVYGERIIDGFRIWDPYRSKLAALLLKSRLPLPISLSIDSIVLYLGASTGTTVSHVSDVVRDGLVYAVEISPRSMRQLLQLAESRRNIIPILGDAARPESYSRLVEPVDLVYQDVAQRNQAEIATLNSARYLKAGGTLVLMIKTRSIDSNASPVEIRSSEIERLLGLEVRAVTDLLPYHHDHWAVVAKKV